MNMFAKILLTAAALNYSAFAYAGPTTCDPKDMGPSGCPADSKAEEKLEKSPTTCDTKAEGPSACEATTSFDDKVTLPNPQSDTDIYQSICINPQTSWLWGKYVSDVEIVGEERGAIVGPSSTARCQPDHDPKRHNPDGTDLGTNTFK